MYTREILLLLLFLSPMSHADQIYGPLRSGETLWTIAPKVKPNDTISRHQMIIALLNANPHAFRMSCNINSLKIKQKLTIPSLETIQQISHQEAVNIYSRQNAAWKAFRKQGVEIQCEESEKPVEHTMAAMSAPVANEVSVAEPAAVIDEDAPIIITESTPLATPEEAISTDDATAVTESNQLVADDEKAMTSYLPIIIVLGIVLFVFVLAFLLRHSVQSRPIPEDLT